MDAYVLEDPTPSAEADGGAAWAAGVAGLATTVVMVREW
jgi:hypothetical protein